MRWAKRFRIWPEALRCILADRGHGSGPWGGCCLFEGIDYRIEDRQRRHEAAQATRFRATGSS